MLMGSPEFLHRFHTILGASCESSFQRIDYSKITCPSSLKNENLVHYCTFDTKEVIKLTTFPAMRTASYLICSSLLLKIMPISLPTTSTRFRCFLAAETFQSLAISAKLSFCYMKPYLHDIGL